MSKTEKLRRMLDERGVEYETDDTQVDGNGTMYRVTYVKEGYGRTWVYEEPPECGLLVSYAHDLGAKDAIAATLGAGTCHDLAETPAYRDKTEFKCSECGYEYSAVGGFGCDCGDEPDFNFCPNCGRRVEVDA